ncbi:MAG: metallophosphatase [Bacteroidales bacterium]|nr:metallophosphatase [Bacteroidales bacterium]
MKKHLIFINILFLLAVCSLVTAQNPIVILHTNDTHSQIDPLQNNDGTLAGGIYCRAAIIDQVRKENKNVLLVDAGDYFQGTPYFNFFKGASEIKFMNLLGYQAAALGNHEFDNGSKMLAKQLAKAKFPIVCANYLFFNKKLNKIVKNYVVIEMDGKRIGIFGLLTDIKALTSPQNYKDLKYLNAIDVADCMVKELRETEKCDYVICLSHLGWNTGSEDNPDDKMLAAQVKGIDVIVGGHSHSVIEKPDVVNGTIILQTGKKGLRIGQLTIDN